MKGDTHYSLLTSEFYDQGRIARVHGKLLGPELAWWADGAWFLFGSAIGITLLAAWIKYDWNAELGFLWIGHFILHAALHYYGMHFYIFRVLFGTRLDVALSEDFIKIGGPLNYRTVPNMLLNFTYELHPKAEQEAELESVKKRPLFKRYRKSWRIVMYNGEVKTVLGSVYKDEDLVTGIVIRLQQMASSIQGARQFKGR